MRDRNENNFTYHKPTEDMLPKFQKIRGDLKEVADYIADEVPPGREQSIAITKLEEAMMWANAAVARHGN